MDQKPFTKRTTQMGTGKPQQLRESLIPEPEEREVPRRSKPLMPDLRSISRSSKTSTSIRRRKSRRTGSNSQLSRGSRGQSWSDPNSLEFKLRILARAANDAAAEAASLAARLAGEGAETEGAQEGDLARRFSSVAGELADEPDADGAPRRSLADAGRNSSAMNKTSGSERAPAPATPLGSLSGQGAPAERERGRGGAMRDHTPSVGGYAAAATSLLGANRATGSVSARGSSAGAVAAAALEALTSTSARPRSRQDSRRRRQERLAQLRALASGKARKCCPLSLPTCLTDCSMCRMARGFIPPPPCPMPPPYADCSDDTPPCLPPERYPFFRPVSQTNSIMKTNKSAVELEKPEEKPPPPDRPRRRKTKGAGDRPRPPWVGPCAPPPPSPRQRQETLRRQTARASAAAIARRSAAAAAQGAASDKRHRGAAPSAAPGVASVAAAPDTKAPHHKKDLGAKDNGAAGNSARDSVA